MGDMGEVFRDRTKYDKARRQKNLEEAKQSKLPWHRFTEWHWRIDLLNDPVDYWPTKNKWRWRGKMYHGDVDGFIANRMSTPDDSPQRDLFHGDAQ